MPLQKIENGGWPHPARLPLGGGWSGHCTAPGHESAIPSQDILEGFCNLGYAAGCGWAPSERAWDAVRFAVVAPGETQKQNSDSPRRTVPVRYVCERNHRPVAHGDLEYNVGEATWLQRHDDPRVQEMAECFLQTYLQKKV